ncbi:hypothetical protein D3C87_1289470 [compost metagenome]
MFFQIGLKELQAAVEANPERLTVTGDTKRSKQYAQGEEVRVQVDAGIPYIFEVERGASGKKFCVYEATLGSDDFNDVQCWLHQYEVPYHVFYSKTVVS